MIKQKKIFLIILVITFLYNLKVEAQVLLKFSENQILGDFSGESFQDTVFGNMVDYLDICTKNLKNKDENVDNYTYAILNIYIANLYYHLGFYEKSTEFVADGILLFEKLKKNKELAYSYYLYGNILRNMNNYEFAIVNYEKSLFIYDKILDYRQKTKVLFFIGLTYFKADKLDEVYPYWNKAFSINEQLNYEDGSSVNLIHLKTKVYSRGELIEFLEYFAEIFSSNLDDKNNQISIFLELSQIHFLDKNHTYAYVYGNNALQKALKIKNNYQILKSHELLYRIYRKDKNEKLSLTHLELYLKCKDSIFDKNLAKIEQNQRKKKINQIRKATKKQTDLSKKENDTLLLYSIILFVMLFLFILMTVLLYLNNKNKRNANDILEQQQQEIIKINDRLELQQKEIRDSILYARRIQKALMPLEIFLEAIFPEYFIINKPKDLISGDFYWLTYHQNKAIIAVADCTGHGVPGAFMSLLGVNALKESLSKINELHADKLLNQTRDQIMGMLHQRGKENENQDGMDIALCIIDFDNNELEYAGAYNPIYIARKNKEESVDIIEIKPDKIPIGIYLHDYKLFTNKKENLLKNDIIYLSTDGYIDQFGGQRGKRFSRKRLKDTLISMHDRSLKDQQNVLEQRFYNWTHIQEKNVVHEQVDDILILGIKID